MTLFEAQLEFQTEEQIRDRIAGETTLLFEDDDLSTAITAVGRWWRRRHRVMPDYFNTLCAFKLYIIRPQRIDDKGELPPSHGLFCYEWKCDRGVPLP